MSAKLSNTFNSGFTHLKITSSSNYKCRVPAGKYTYQIDSGVDPTKGEHLRAVNKSRRLGGKKCGINRRAKVTGDY